MIEYLNSDSTQLHNPADISTKFVEYFSIVGQNFANKIASPRQNIDKYLNSIRSNENTLFLLPTDPTEVKKLIKNLPNKRSSSHDGINNIILKESGEYLVFPFTDLFNESMTQGVFLSTMKIAEVIQLYKNKSRHEVENYQYHFC